MVKYIINIPQSYKNMDRLKFRERKLDVHVLKNGELLQELHGVDFTNATWRRVEDMLKIQELKYQHMRSKFTLARLKGADRDTRWFVMISIQEYRDRGYILKLLYDETNQVRGFSLDYNSPSIDDKSINVEKEFTDRALHSNDSPRNSIKWFARELQWHLHHVNNGEFDERKFFYNYFSAMLPSSTKGYDKDTFLSLVWLLLLALNQLAVAIFRKCLVNTLLTRWPLTRRWYSSWTWKRLKSLAKDRTKTKVHLYRANGDKLVCKFEKPDGYTYWTSFMKNYSTSPNSDEAEDFVLRCAEELPYYVNDCRYLGFVQSSPSQVVQIAKELESQIKSKAFVITKDKGWARSFFYTLTARYDIHYSSEELPLRCEYPLVQQVSKFAEEKKIQVLLRDHSNKREASIETDITLHNLKDFLDNSTLFAKCNGDMREAHLFKGDEGYNYRLIKIVFYDGYRKDQQKECYVITLQCDDEGEARGLHVTRHDGTQADGGGFAQYGTTFTTPRALLIGCVRALFELVGRIDASRWVTMDHYVKENFIRRGFSRALFSRLWPIPPAAAY